MKYHVIQADNSRQDNVKDIMSKINGEIVNIKSISVKDLENFYAENPDFKVTGPGLNKPEIGCFASHYNSWKYVVDNNLPELLVIEDDALLGSDFFDKLEFYKKYLPKTYEIFFTFVSDQMKMRYVFKEHYMGNIYVTKAFQDWSTLCYLISFKGAKQAINLTNVYGMRRPVDNFILEFGIQCYSPHPDRILPISINNNYTSLIQGEQDV